MRAKKSRQLHLTVNVTLADIATLDAIVERHGPFATRHQIHLLALRHGLDTLKDNPMRVVELVAKYRESRS